MGPAGDAITWTCRRFRADPRSLGRIRTFVRRRGRELGLDQHQAERLTLAIDEAAVVALRRGIGRYLDVELTDRGDRIIGEVTDQLDRGSLVPLDCLPDPLGLALPSASSDYVELGTGDEVDSGIRAVMSVSKRQGDATELRRTTAWVWPSSPAARLARVPWT